MKHSLFAMLLLLWAGQLAPSARPSPLPKIRTISANATSIVIIVTAPPGVQKVTLESRLRAEGSSWAPRAIHRFAEKLALATDITFNFPRTENLELLRVRADEQETLPMHFFTGTSYFGGQVTPIEIGTTTGASTGTSTGTTTGSTTGTTGATTTDPGSTTTGPGTTTGGEPREVVESDIWKLSGDTLYFFNQYRGLQVVDISNPAAPTLRGQLSVPDSGEQMYVLPSKHAVLLTRRVCTSGQLKIIIVDASGQTPRAVSEHDVDGELRESRMVGSVLYVVTTAFQQSEIVPQIWEGGTLVTSFDLANPAAPVQRDKLWQVGGGAIVTASQRHLFVVSPDQKSIVSVIDISSPTGEITLAGSFVAHGRVADKFKINADASVVSVVSQGSTYTALENFSLQNLAPPTRLGVLTFAPGENLFATRFDGSRVYVVTYRRTDPLWVIDNSDPTNPVKKGELHVPGWSTYLKPLGNRIVAMGIDDVGATRVAVSLFDVSDPSTPSLLSKVVLGDNYSWSEANGDEKAMTILPDDELILAPWQSYASTYMQLIDLGDTNVVARGKISDQANPRRATLHRDHVVSISSRTLATYDIANRDQPALKAKLDLSWRVDKVLLAGDHLLEFERGDLQQWNLGSSAAPVVRVARADAPNTVIGIAVLEAGLPLAGIELRDNKLYLAQTRGVGVTWDGSPSLVISIWDVSRLPILQRLSETRLNTAAGINAALTALWPKPGLLVWNTGFNSGGHFVDIGTTTAGGTSTGIWTDTGTTIGVTSGTSTSTGAIFGSGVSHPGSGIMLALDVADPAAPVKKSELNIRDRGSEFSPGIVAPNGLVYMSHAKVDLVQIPRPPDTGTTTGSTGATSTGTTGGATGGTTSGGWIPEPTMFAVVRQTFLDVIDFADPSNPVPRRPTPIPGTLLGISHSGQVIYTTGSHSDASGVSDNEMWLDANAFDGVNAYLIDSVKLTSTSHAHVKANGDILIDDLSSIDYRRLSDAGQLDKIASTTLSTGLQQIRYIGDLLIGVTANSTQFFDTSDPANVKLKAVAPHGCVFIPMLDEMDGRLDRGVWMPDNSSSVRFVPFTSSQ